MNLNQIASRITNPDSCLGSEIPALKELTEKYPFAQVFSILYLKALSNQNDVGFDEALQKHAYRVTDRMKLYDLIHSVSQPEIEVNTDQGALSEVEPVDSDVLDIAAEILMESMIDHSDRDAINLVSTENQSTENGIEPDQEKTALVEIEPIDDFRIPEIDSIEITNDEIETVPHDPPKEESMTELTSPDFIQDEVELEIISQVVATVYNENLEQSVPEKPVEEKKSEALITPGLQVENKILEGKRTFSSWLHAGTKSTVESVLPAVEELQNKTKPIEKQIDKIIDQFIEKEPTISRPKKEFYSPTKKAKESISSAGLIYTETLADIFAIQGNFPKAITAYEQLMLTNPEKKIFFAQRIKELKEKLNT